MRTTVSVIAVAMVAIVSVADVAFAADDGGVHAFLANVFGEAGRSAAAPPLQPRAVVTHVARIRPLTIGRRKPTLVAAAGPTRPAKVSIFEDPTLRPGDAVMMADGVRVFVGSRSWPYTRADFVPLAQAHDLKRGTVEILAALNDVPRI